MSDGMQWDLRGQFEAADGDRVGLFALDNGHWAVSWAYGAPHGPQLVSYDPERAQEVFEATRSRYEGQGALRYDSRTAWQGGSL
ncbi:hypothetical protein ACFV6B_30285 [Streptomyces microflavus]|uniref:hypothetical protein n=1 Tax=Streptomyces microflavus TaxID=1919 RepID=UPI0036691B2B